MKTCFKCNQSKPLTEFYRHPRMADGHLNKCKACTKSDATAHRNQNIERVREYDRLRDNLPHRVAARAEYAKTDAFKASHAASVARLRVIKADRYAARNAVSNALRDGRLTPLPCFICGEKSEAHHPDYSRPLDVVWLCPPHHKQTHAMARELMREAA